MTILSLDDTRLKRLRYRSWHRGCKETDLILGPFSDSKLHTLTADELDLYELLLEESDADIWNWLVEKTEPGEEYGTVIAHLKDFSRTQIKV